MDLTQEQYRTALGITRLLKVNSFLQCKVCNEILFSASGFLEHKLRVCVETVVDIDEIGKPKKIVNKTISTQRNSEKQLKSLNEGLKRISGKSVRIKVEECPVSHQLSLAKKI